MTIFFQIGTNRENYVQGKTNRFENLSLKEKEQERLR